MTRSLLFLQGPHGPFFRQLGGVLRAAGHRVTRVNFNGGDVIDWPFPDTLRYCRPRDEWPAWIEDLARRRDVTDLVVYGDCRPLHRLAIRTLRPLGVRIHVFEEGYLRPDWITLERDGVNGNSRMRLDPQTLLAAPSPSPETRLPALGATTPSMVRLCLRYYLAAKTLAPLFPHYRSHRLQPALTEARGWLRHALRRRAARATEPRLVERLLAERGGLFLLPLQLASDAQIRSHSSFDGMAEVIALVVQSFARAAATTDRLVVKNHPLDNGLIDYRRVVETVAAEHGVAGRVVYLEDGHLPTLLRCSEGVVTVNSTAGLQAIHHRCPTKVLGRAVYALPGLVDPQPLDGFWRAPQPPNDALYRAFRAHMLARCQLNGSFFTAEGRARLLGPVAERLATPTAGATARVLAPGRGRAAADLWPGVAEAV
jgi:capsular polysaccharide export protein